MNVSFGRPIPFLHVQKKFAGQKRFFAFENVDEPIGMNFGGSGIGLSCTIVRYPVRSTCFFPG